jgi:large subunit ribosomal protein L24
MDKLRIKKGDNVVSLTGKDKGKTGIVDELFRKDRKAAVLGLNMAKKHMKPSRKAPQGGILDFPAKVSISNLMIVCPACQKATKITYKINEKNKIRICKKCGESVEGSK